MNKMDWNDWMIEMITFFLFMFYINFFGIRVARSWVWKKVCCSWIHALIVWNYDDFKPPRSHLVCLCPRPAKSALAKSLCKVFIINSKASEDVTDFVMVKCFNKKHYWMSEIMNLAPCVLQKVALNLDTIWSCSSNLANPRALVLCPVV